MGEAVKGGIAFLILPLLFFHVADVESHILYRTVTVLWYRVSSRFLSSLLWTCLYLPSSSYHNLKVPHSFPFWSFLLPTQEGRCARFLLWQFPIKKEKRMNLLLNKTSHNHTQGRKGAVSCPFESWGAVGVLCNAIWPLSSDTAVARHSNNAR